MLVSVIIPCYNVEDYIDECIKSVIDQTYKEIEIICVNNNSTDNTFLKLQSLREKHPSIQLLEEKTSGAPFARNRGLDKAKGEFIQFLDADDLLKNVKIEHQINLVKKNTKKNIGFIAAASIKKNLHGTQIPFSEIHPDTFLSPFINKCGNTCSNLWHKESVLNVGKWDVSIKSSQEADLMLRLVLAGNEFLIDNEPLTIIRERESGQISHRNPAEKWKQFIGIRLKYINALKKSNSAIYEKHKGIFYDFLMVSVIELAKYDREEAIKMYSSSIKSYWNSSGNYGFSKLKVALIKTIGFASFLKIVKSES